MRFWRFCSADLDKHPLGQKGESEKIPGGKRGLRRGAQLKGFFAAGSVMPQTKRPSDRPSILSIVRICVCT